MKTVAGTGFEDHRLGLQGQRAGPPSGEARTIIGAGGRADTARAQMQLLETLGETRASSLSVLTRAFRFRGQPGRRRNSATA